MSWFNNQLIYKLSRHFMPGINIQFRHWFHRRFMQHISFDPIYRQWQLLTTTHCNIGPSKPRWYNYHSGLSSSTIISTVPSSDSIRTKVTLYSWSLPCPSQQLLQTKTVRFDSHTAWWTSPKKPYVFSHICVTNIMVSLTKIIFWSLQ